MEKEAGWKRAAELLKGGKGQKFLVVAGLAGMALILVSQFWPEQETVQESPDKTASSVTAEQYVEQTEKRLSELIGHIAGAGECQVMVTLENGVEYVYASEQKINSDRVEDTGTDSSKLSEKEDSEQSVIMVETENGKEGLLVTELQPTVRGVVVVCEGGGEEDVAQRIVSAVTTALNISSKRVCVSPAG